MPHTRAAQLRVAMEAAKSRDMPQMQNLNWNMGWNDYQDEDLPGLTYHPDSLAWFPDESAASGQPECFTDSQFTTADAANSLPEPNSEKASNSNFCGLQPWYSTGMQEFSSVTPAATTRPQLSGGEFKSFESTSLDEESSLSDQSYSSQPWSLTISRQPSSMSDEAFTRVPCISPTVDLAQELDDAPSHSSEDENARGNTARADANKKRKIAHSIIERNYRSRIKSGMAELRHCVPPTARGRSFLDSKRPGDPQLADNAAPNHPSGKVATLEMEALHGRLDVMQRRNVTLQKIAMSKASTNTPATSTYMEKMEEEDTEEDDEGSKNEQTSKRSKKSPRNRARSDDSNCR
jgi:hypothetical protein